MSEYISDLPGWVGVYRRVKSWCITLSRPRVIFGAPQQPLDSRYEPGAAWWHVPIIVKPAVLTRQRSIQEATVRLIDDARPGSTGISLRWYSRDHRPAGISERTLTAGRIYLVPVVRRDENQNEGRAFITNENWMLDKSDKDKWPICTGAKRHYHLEVWSGDRKWRSDLPYRITVPDAEVSNGHFTMETFYGNLY